MKQRRVSVIAVVAIAAVIAACGGASDDPQATPPPVGAEPGAVPEPDAPSPSEGESGGDPAVTTRPEGFPDEMPLPPGAQYSFSIPDVNQNDVLYFYIERPVAEVIAEMEALLPANGWEIVDVVNGVAWMDDQLFEVDGHGLQMYVYAEPSAGSETETALSFGMR